MPAMAPEVHLRVEPNVPAVPEPVDGFGSTAWSVILAAAQEDGAAALDRLCRKYWKPVYTFARRRGLAPWDAEDATQDFFRYLLSREWLKRADPQRGSFRAYLLTLLRNFLANRRRTEHALKRGGPARDAIFGIDADEGEVAAVPAQDADPARAYERAWAACVLEAALARLEAEQAGAGHATRFRALQPFLTRPPAPGEYERLAAGLELTRNRIALALHRLSRRLAELIRTEVADTLSDRSALDAELRLLFDALGR